MNTCIFGKEPVGEEHPDRFFFRAFYKKGIPQARQFEPAGCS